MNSIVRATGCTVVMQSGGADADRAGAVSVSTSTATKTVAVIVSETTRRTIALMPEATRR